MLSIWWSSDPNTTRKKFLPHPACALRSFLTDQLDQFPRWLYKLQRSNLSPAPNTDGAKEGEKRAILAFSTVSVLLALLSTVPPRGLPFFLCTQYLLGPARAIKTLRSLRVPLRRMLAFYQRSQRTEGGNGYRQEPVGELGVGGVGERDVLREGNY